MDVLESVRAFARQLDEGELTPEFLKAVVLLMVAFLVGVGVLTYLVTFVVLGF